MSCGRGKVETTKVDGGGYVVRCDKETFLEGFNGSPSLIESCIVETKLQTEMSVK